ncbi:MAG: D-tyrosyl-tRNA(Tyr) deacylase [Opitutales bacterium]|nr:D-tyrosyl-tRNA(Tyr) deacylase [Opitutales bacterium]
MRAVLQRVTKASVSVNESVVGSIGPGFLLFLGVGHDDGQDDIDWLVHKIPQIRVWEDVDGKLNRSLNDIDGEVLVISQFTLFGNLRKGTRPSFNHAALPEKAEPVYELFVRALSDELGKTVPTGRFAHHMHIEASNDGPVTLLLDTKNKTL